MVHTTLPLKLDIIARENAVWQALVDGDAKADAEALDASFLGIYGDGFASKAEHVAQLANGPSIEAFVTSDHRFRELGTDHAVLSYAATFRRVGAPADETFYVTSIWERTATSWVNILSQDTAEVPA